MTIIARTIAATPARSASSAWKIMVDLISTEGTLARAELETVTGIASSIISDEVFKDSPAVVFGTGPRVRIYCLYDDEAITGEKANENVLAFNPTDGDWKMSLPCSAEDLEWVQGELKKKSTRITAREEDTSVSDDDFESSSSSSNALEFNREVFLKS